MSPDQVLPLRRGLGVAAATLCLMLLPAASSRMMAQEAVSLPVAATSTQAVMQEFSFASDGPIGPGWTRPDEIARSYFHEQLPLLFQRTLRLDGDVPAHGKLAWLFTGPHASFTVELTGSKVRVFQRFYDSSALYSGQGNYPDKVVRDEEQQYTGHARTLTVVVDSHLSLRVLLNGRVILTQPCVFDVTRHQLMFSAPRTEHLVMAGALLSETTGRSTVTVSPQQRHQTMIGFGGSPSIPAYEQLSEAGKKQYWELLQRYNLLLDREYPMGTQLKPDLSNFDHLSDATPHYYGDNFPNGEVSSFEYSKHALALGGEVIYEMWALPKWATKPYSGPPVLDAWNKSIKITANPEEYARIVVEYCRRARERTGSAPAIVGIQNEVEQPTEVFNQMALTLRRELDKAGFQSTKIHMADASYLYFGIDRAHALKQQNPAGWAVIDYTAAHEYDYQEYFANPDLYDARMLAMRDASEGKPFIATEICINDPHYQEPSYRVSFNVAQLYQKNLTELDAVSLMYCWLLLDVEQPNFGSSRSLLVPDRSHGSVPVASSYQLRVLGAFSRHVLKGMTRVEAKSLNPDLMTAAFEQGDKASMIVMNRSTEPQRLDVQWAGHNWVQMERTSFYAENETSTSLPREVVIQPGEIVTLSTFAVN